jgi:hypothetical protein
LELSDLLKLKPKLHDGPKGEPYSWQISDDIMHVIDKYVNQASNTLETGAGVSTLLFAMKRANHVCIVPFAKEASRIKEFCIEHNIALDRLHFEIDFSENVLPRVALGELDLVLIDGAHGFPIPFIDWYYGAAKLKTGGILIIDDTQVWTGDVLKKFLLEEPEWQLVTDYSPRCVVFKKVKDGGFGKNEWAQPYVVQKTVDLLYPDYSRLIMPFAPGRLRAKELESFEVNKQKMSTIVTNLLDLYKKFEADKDTTITKIKDGILFDCKSDDPRILLPYSFSGVSNIIRIVIDSSCDTYLQLYYQTTDTLKYTEDNSRIFTLISGENELVVSVNDDKATGQLRLDPGSKRGKYLIKSLEIRDIRS